MIKPILATIAAFAVAGPAAAQTLAPMPEETAIPFVSRDGIHEWKADGDRGLYIRSIDSKWYYARTLGKCGRLHSADNLGFQTSALDQLDRHGAIIAQGWRCPLSSLVRSTPPPGRK